MPSSNPSQISPWYTTAYNPPYFPAKEGPDFPACNNVQWFMAFVATLALEGFRICNLQSALRRRGGRIPPLRQFRVKGLEKNPGSIGQDQTSVVTMSHGTRFVSPSSPDTRAQATANGITSQNVAAHPNWSRAARRLVPSVFHFRHRALRSLGRTQRVSLTITSSVRC